MTYQKKFISCLVILLICLAFIDYNNLDIKLQSLFFNFETKEWLVHRDDQVLKFWFYRLPKYIIITYGVGILLWLSDLRYKKTSPELQIKLSFLVFSLILIPLLVALLKHYSPIYCPNHITEFYGGHPFISPFDIFNYDVFFNNTGKCSPAGHASGGFSLISLYFVIPNNIFKKLALIFGLSMGSIMGFYQLAKGAHYLSDTLITLAIAYLVCITLERLMLKKISD